MLNLLICCVTIISTKAETPYDYGMVIDAGSTHSALFVYQFNRRTTTINQAPQSIPIQIASGPDLDPVTTLKHQNQSDHLVQVMINSLLILFDI